MSKQPEGMQIIIDKYPKEYILQKLILKWLETEGSNIVVSEEEFREYTKHMGMKGKKDLGIIFFGKCVRRPYENI